MSATAPSLPSHDLGHIAYAPAYDLQLHYHTLVAQARDEGRPIPGHLLLLEHNPPVITLSHRPTATQNLVASPALLAHHGVTTRQTDRGGDITYHGPGQLVVYPILDLNHLGLRLHDYMRKLEDAVIATVARFGVRAHRDPTATGVWVGGDQPPAPGQASKLCAMGIRVKKWISLHGLALNVTTNLDHFSLIVPCGLAGRPVTSLQQLLGSTCPTMPQVKAALAEELTRALLPTDQGATARSGL